MARTLKKDEILVQGKKFTTHKIHCFHEGDTSLCGLCDIEGCDQIKMVEVSKRLHLYLWPKHDLNYCGRCRMSLNAMGVI